MDQELERVLKGLEAAAEFAKTYRFEMTDDYVALLEKVEAMPRNQSGADKSPVWPAQRTYREFFKNARLLPQKP